mgnify:CR=1 FL=1
MTLLRITAPTVEPVTTAEAKLHLRVTHSTDDDLIDALIAAAREQCEHLTGRALVTQTWERVLDAFPAVEIELGRPPVIAITSVTYTDAAGDSQILDSADYSLDNVTEPGYLLPAEGVIWPTTLDTANAVRVRFTCGYGATADSVPAALRAWIKLRLATLYKHREEIVAGISVADLPNGYTDRLIDRYRLWS